MGFKTEEEATDFAKKALNALKWVGWQYEVWHNMRWNVKLYCGPVSVYHDTYDRKWHAMISSDPKSATGGGGLWTRGFAKYADTPEAAVEAEFMRFNESRKKVEELFRTIHTAVLKVTTSKG